MELEHTKARLTATDKIYLLITAGRAIFTLQSTKLDKRYTYRIKVDDKNPQRFFCQVMFGNENDSDKDYRFIGWFYADNMTLRHSEKCKVTNDDKRYTMLRYFLQLIASEEYLPETCHFYPSIHCARCGHLLTTPESIARGIGPECAKR